MKVKGLYVLLSKQEDISFHFALIYVTVNVFTG